MRKSKAAIRIMALVSAVSITSSLVGCGANATSTITSNEVSSSNQEITASTDETADASDGMTATPSESEPEESADTSADSTEDSTDSATSATTEVPEEEQTDEYGLTEQQRNSFSMLYYLAITAEKIRISKDNRLILDDIYTSLLNDINPGAIDETTQDHLKNLRDIIKSYINISVKRERLQYIYNQDKAAAIRSAVPNPLAILSMTNALNWRKLATSVVYTVVDSYNNYKSASEAADRAFLTSGWELDDEETATIQKNRERAFDYMVDIVQEYGLDGKLTLNEKAIGTFAEICEIESIPQRKRRLESEEETYKLLGNYWLELAECYFETEQYPKCLDCISKYNDLSMDIYRKDYNYVQFLPKAIVAAQETLQGEDYIITIRDFADSIIKNTATTEWSIRYFAAQVYLDLYKLTNDRVYLNTAYDIAYDNVTILLDKQRALNATYLADVQEVTLDEPDYDYMDADEKKKAKQEYKDEKVRVKDYNKQLKEARQTELPHLYEPLVLNCDLLFALADKLNISGAEKNEIEAILQTDTNGIFISKPINNRYSFSALEIDLNIEMKKNEVVIPVSLLTDESKIVIEVTQNDNTIIFEDNAVSKVERKGDTIDSFFAVVTGKQLKDYTWSENSEVTIRIINGENTDELTYRFKVVNYKENWIFPDTVEFEEE